MLLNWFLSIFIRSSLKLMFDASYLILTKHVHHSYKSLDTYNNSKEFTGSLFRIRKQSCTEKHEFDSLLYTELVIEQF